MRVRISNAPLLGELALFLKGVDCRVEKVDLATVDVSVPRAPDEAQAAREIGIYLRTWQAMHPGAHVRIVEKGSDASLPLPND